MQIKPHQIPHFARQRERLADIRNSWNAEPKEEGSYFSKSFKRFKHYVDGTVQAYVFEFNNQIKDSHDDIILPGAFSKSLLENNFWKINENNNTNTTSTNTI